MNVYKLTTEQKNTIISQSYDGVQYFNPILDYDNNWVISIEEVSGCTNKSFQWVKDLPLINYNPITNEFI